MEKQIAIKLLGETPKKAAAAMGYKSAHAIYMWPDVLSTQLSDQVRGAALRIKETKPRKQAKPKDVI